MGMSFQGPPPPPPPFWKEPAFWLTTGFSGASLVQTWFMGEPWVQASFAIAAGLAVAAYSNLRLRAAREDHVRRQTGLLRRRGQD